MEKIAPEVKKSGLEIKGIKLLENSNWFMIIIKINPAEKDNKVTKIKINNSFGKLSNIISLFI